MDSELASIAEKLKGAELFRGLSAEKVLRIVSEGKAKNRNFERGETLVRQGEAVRDIGILLAGILFEEKNHLDGRRQILQALAPQSYVCIEAAFSSPKTAPCAIVAAEPGNIVWLRGDALLKNEVLMKNALRLLSDESIRRLYKADVLSIRTVRGRILSYLSIVSERRGTKTINIGMTQEEFAEFLCVDRTSLTYELGKMRREGILEVRGKIYLLKIL